MKVFRIPALMILAGLAAVLPAEAATTRGQIIGDNVNLRAKDLPEAEVVTQLNDGDAVEIKGNSGDWAEVVPPEKADLWVHKDFVQDGVVRGKTLNVRAGPGINFNVVGTLSRGDKVTVRGEMTEWYKIAPPAACSLWVSRQYVGSPSKPKPEPERPRPVVPPARQTATVPAPVRRPDDARVEQPAPQRQTVTIPPRVVAAAPAAEGVQSDLPANWKLIPLEGQGKRIERSGRLRSVGWRLRRPSHFRLVRYLDSGRFETICYIRGNREQLSEWVDEEIGIRGREYWIQNEKYPVVVVDQLMLPARTRPQGSPMDQPVPPVRPRPVPPAFEPTN